MPKRTGNTALVTRRGSPSSLLQNYRTLRGWEHFLEDSHSLVYAFACHLIAVQATNASMKTIKLYDGRHKQFLTFLQQHGLALHVDQLNAANLRRSAIWLREHSRGSRGGESAARALVTTLKTTSAWLADEGFIDADLVARVRRPKISSVARTPFSMDEIRALRDAAMDSPMPSRNLTIIRLLLDTGVRVGGLVSILTDDVSARDRRIVLRLKGGSRQTVYFGDPQRRDGGGTVRVLRVWLTERETMAKRWPERHRGHLFLGFDGWPLTEQGVRQLLSRLATASGVKHVFPHRFRHTFATMYLVRHQGDETGLRDALGHLSNDMYRVYLHLSHEILAERAGRVALSEAWLSEEEPPRPIREGSICK